MTSETERRREPWVLPALTSVLVLCLGAASAAWVWRDLWWPAASGALPALWDALQTTPPLLFFTALAVLPALPIPISPFYLISASLYGFWFSYACIGVAVAVNLAISFGLASGVFRPVVERIVGALGYGVPRLRPGEHARLALVVRVTPGPPYFAQNLLLGLTGIPFRVYMAVSWPTQMGWAFVFLVLGESATRGSVGLAIAGLGGLVAVTVATRMLRARLAGSA